MDNIVKARLVIRHGLSEVWESKNPVLLAGEPGVATDKGTLKVGDGHTPWNDLAPISGGLTQPATEAIIGGVLSSKEDNKVSVKEDGTMELNRVSTSLLYVPEDNELILDGGKS